MSRVWKIPISFHPLFWVFASLIGWLNSGNLVGTAIWLVIIVFSVLIHEFGHALTAILFGQNARIDFIALGGLTSYQGKSLKLWQQFIIVLNGPLFGFLLFFLAMLVLNLNIFSNQLILSFLVVLRNVNLFWSVVNLLPVLPLDGGQLLRILFEGIWGVKGIRYAMFTGMLLAGALSFISFMLQNFIFGAIFFLFAFQSFDSFRKSKFISSSDKSESLKGKIIQAEIALKAHQKEKAKEILTEILSESKKGIIYTTAAQYLAFILFEEHEIKKTYEVLSPLKKQLDPQGISLLHKVAFLVKDFNLVEELSPECFKASPTQEVALTNAKAFAALKKGKHAGGWLQTAYQIQPFNIEKVLSESFFKVIENDKDFLFFVDRLKKHK